MSSISLNSYNFLFHPLHKEHSVKKSTAAIITGIVLTILTGGVYVVVLGVVRLKERISSSRQEEDKVSKAAATVLSSYVGNKALKMKMQTHLAKLKVLAKQNQWQHIQKHTSHKDSAFDWWMFPTDRKSDGQGEKYKLTKEKIAVLKKDKKFMSTYREGVLLVASSWGFDLKNKGSLKETSTQKWVGYQVRLGKMLHSLKLFNEKDLHQALVRCIELKGIKPTLQKWIQDLM